MKASTAPAQIDPRERVVRAAVCAVYDRYCSSTIAELEAAVVALIGAPLPPEEDAELAETNHYAEGIFG